MTPARRWIVLSTLVVLGLAAGALVVRDNTPSAALGDASTTVADPTNGTAAERAVLADAHFDAWRHRLVRGEASGGIVQAPPNVAPPAGGVVDWEDAPTPPDGYAFTSAPTTMAHAAYRPSPRSQEVHFGDGFDWLADESPLPIVRKAERAQRDWVFGWVRLAHGVDTRGASKALEPLGIDVLGDAGGLLRAKLPADETRLNAALDLAAVVGVGVAPAERKVAADFAAHLRNDPLLQAPVVITLMANDSGGHWRSALQALGAVVGRFDADIQAYSASVDAAVLDAVVEADFVLAVEPMRLYKAAHDTAVPAMGADSVRRHAASPGRFRGRTGAPIPIGVMDTGLNTNHQDIAMYRRSICGANFVEHEPERRRENADLWVDWDGHGTHVTGTILGNGFTESRYAGMVPGVEHIRFAKVLARFGFGFGDDVRRGMDFLAQATSCGAANEPARRPLIVNVSLSAASRVWQGRSPGERKLDAVVWGHRQLYVVAHSNAGISGFSNYGAAKNSLSVGAVDDSGELASWSSWGPTHDGRLAPQVVATGVDVYSAMGNGSRGGYRISSGTSMASPAVAGVAALLMHAAPGYRRQPALTRARLMASAIKPDAWLDATDAFPATNSSGPGILQMQYGLGKASARTSALQRAQADGWENGAALLTPDGDSYGFSDIVVPEGAQRLDIVLTWDEPPSEAIASTVLNDLDLWLDADADCVEAACGEHSSTSRRDNVEWIIVRNPAAGLHRVRVVPHRIYTAPPRAGLAWTLVRGAPAPSLSLTVDEVRPSGERKFRIGFSLSSDAYIAAGVQLAFESCRYEDALCNPDTRVSLVTTEDDAPWRALNWRSGLFEAVQLGEVAVGERQRVEFDVDMAATSAAARVGVVASAWNATPAIASVVLPASGDAAEAAKEPPAEVPPPRNDDFVDAEMLSGATGSIESDLLSATFEPGEPFPEGSRARLRPLGSVWYEWQAPSSGIAQFRVALPQDGNWRNAFSSSDVLPAVDVLQGDNLVALRQLAPSAGSASFFAERGANYWIRVKTQPNAAPAPFVLQWTQGPRPANDDFRAAVPLEGGEGSVADWNYGATLEAEEHFGELGATVWYRWTAPDDGVWQFQVDDRLAVLVFAGNRVGSLRLITNLPWGRASASVRAGATYRIAVASRGDWSNAGAGHDFRLEWRAVSHRPWDDEYYFANATEVTGADGSTSAANGRWVEPGEPVESGVRTRWWRWTAPSDGRFVWRLVGTNDLKVAVFTPTDTEDASPSDLRLVASLGPRVTVKELAFDATEGQPYWISVGFRSGDAAAFDYWSQSGTLEWGETPVNDTLAQRAVLSGDSGSIAISNQWGTLEEGEASGVLGHSSLWWEFAPDAPGWYRFRIDALSATLAVYRIRDAGFEGLELLARSHGGWRPPDEQDVASVLFDATVGDRYVVRLGTQGEAAGGEATLEWEPADAPTWLRYRGRLHASALGLDREDPTALRSATMAFESRGEVLYLASPKGLHMLRRDSADGALEQVRVLSMDRADALLWDAERTKLYAYVDCEWRQLAPHNDARVNYRDAGALRFGGTPLCEVRSAFLDAAGMFLYHGHSSGLDVLALGDDRLTHVQTVDIGDLKDALLAPDGAGVFASTGGVLRTFVRDDASGMLTQAGETDLLRQTEAIAIGSSGGVLFALAEDGSVDAYDVSQLADPRHIHALGAFGDVSWPNINGECRLASARFGASALDAFCRNSAFSAAMRNADESAVLEASDYVANWYPDRFNAYVPEFRSQALAVSPDSRHAYIYSEGDILIFERIGNGTPAAGDDESGADR